MLHKYKELKNKLHNYLNRYSLLKQFSDKNYKELQRYRQEVPALYIEIESYKKAYEDEKQWKEKYKKQVLEQEKLLTQSNSEYTLDIPRLDIQKIETALKSCDVFLLTTIRELIRLDTYEMMKSLANTMQDTTKYEISIATNTIRRRNEAWLGVLDKAIDRKTVYADKIEGKAKPLK